MSQPTFWDVLALVQNGFSYDEARTMHPLERRAFTLAICEQNGGKIDWETGLVEYPQGTSPP